MLRHASSCTRCSPRGRHANHAYLAAGATTGDPHQLIHPDAVHPQTVRETLERILDNDGAPTSATTELETAHDPMTLLRHARERYDDALNTACEHVAGPAAINAVEAHAEELVPGITAQPAWPTLRQRLIHAAANNDDPIELLDYATGRGRLHDAHDPAATLTWRLEAHLDEEGGSYRLPARVGQNTGWRTYLHARQQALDETRYQTLMSTDDPAIDSEPVNLRGLRESRSARHHPQPTAPEATIRR